MTEDTANDSSTQPRGILSPADRAYLRGEKELSQSAERNTRQRIRERIRAGVSDFELLWGLLADRDLEQVFYPDDEEERQAIRSAAQQSLSFMLLGLWTNRDPHEGRLENAIEQAAFANDWLTSADVEIDTEKAPNGDLLLAKLRHKEERIEELKERIKHENLSDSERSKLKEEVQKEAALEYYLFEKGFSDPTVDAEKFASIEVLGEKLDLRPEDVEASHEAWEEAPVVRQTLPIVIDKSYLHEGDQE